MGKIHDVFQRIKDPADRAEMARRFGVTLASTGEPCASLDPPRRGTAPDGVKSDGVIRTEADLLRAVAAARVELGLPPRDQAAGDDVPAGLINSEETLVREVKRTRRALGLS